MKSKAQDGGRKQSEIAGAALRLFLENGYEATSMRMIASEIGCEPGLIYYYFKNKDEAFEAAFARLFEDFGSGFPASDDCPDEPYAALYPLFRRFSESAARFSAEYGGRLHWTVRGAVRERALSGLFSRVSEMLCRLAERGTIDPADPCAAAEFIAYGIGNAILDGGLSAGRIDRLAECAEAVLRPVSCRAGGFIPSEAVSAEGFNSFLAALGSTENGGAISERIAAHEVLAVRSGEKLIGAAVFSRARRSVDFLAVLPEYRRLGIGTRLISALLGRFSPGDTVTAAFGEDRKPAAALYSKLGFTESRATAPFGNPIICMTLRIPKHAGERNDK